jgi:AraC-like DNA-binding protein
MADQPTCRVLYANQLVIDQRWAWRLSDPFWRLYFNRDAGAAIADEQRRWAMPPYRAVLVPAGADLRGSCSGPVRHFYIHFETPGLSAAWIRRSFREPLVLPDDAVLRAMLDALALEAVPVYPSAPGRDGRWHVPDRPAASHGGARWTLRVQAAAAWALARALEQLAPEAVAELAGDAGADAELEPALRHIDEHLAEPLTVARLAKRCGLSVDHFGRRFARATGRTPMRYVQERRIARAADRLIHGGEGIDAIARASGFANRFHFSRLFARAVGTPPAQYRRQHRRG